MHDANTSWFSLKWNTFIHTCWKNYSGCFRWKIPNRVLKMNFSNWVTVRQILIFCSDSGKRSGKISIRFKFHFQTYFGTFRLATFRYIVFAGVLMHCRSAAWWQNKQHIHYTYIHTYIYGKTVWSSFTFTIKRRFTVQLFITDITNVRRSVTCRYPLMRYFLAFILK